MALGTARRQDTARSDRHIHDLRETNHLGLRAMANAEGRPRRRLPATERRRLILEAAREAFVEAGEGMSGVSVREIAKRSGIDEALVYRHFGTKEDLYFEAVLRPVEEIFQQFVRGVADAAFPDAADDSAQARIQREWDLTYAMLRQLCRVDPAVLRSVAMLLFGDPRHSGAFYARTLSPALEQLEQLVVAELPNWPHRAFSVPIAVRATIATCFWTVVEHDLAGRPLDADETARELCDLIIYGMATPDADRPR